MIGDRSPSFGWRWIGRCVLIKRGKAIQLLAMSSVIYVLGLVFPVSVQKTVDRIVAGSPVGRALATLFVVVVAATMLEAVLTRVRQTIIIDLATFIDRRISRIAFGHLMRARVDGAQTRGGETINRFAQARKIQTFVLNDVPRGVFDGGGLLVAVGAMMFYDRWVACAVLATSPLVLVAVRSPLLKVRVASGNYFQETGRQQNVLAETVGAIMTVKSLGLESVRMRLWVSATGRMLASLRRVMEVQREYAVSNQVASRLLLLLVTAIGCWRLASRHISVGDLLALQMLAGRITGPLLQSSDLYSRYQDVDVAIEQLGEFLRTPREVPSARPALRRFGSGGVVLSGVSLTYPNAVRHALCGVDLVLPDRGVVAIVGRNGSGKSTLVRVLLGLNRDYEGRILFAGNDLRQYDPRWLRGQIGTVDQDTVLFSGSVRANLSGNRIVGEAALLEALAFADALEIVNELPKGLDTELAENGRSLSGGQRQRLSIARAVVRDPRVAFFDEPAAFLDAEAAVDLERRLARWGRERLLVLVSHHLAATRDADLIVVLDQGRVAGLGRHEDLLVSTPCYASLWNDYNRTLETPKLSVG